MFFLEKFQSEGGGSKTVWNFSEKWKSCARISPELAHAIKSKKKVRFGRERLPLSVTVCADELLCLLKMSRRV